MIAASSNAAEPAPSADEEEYVTVMVADQVFGLPIHRVHDVFIASSVTPVPLAPSEVIGLLNLRGRVVTALCLRRRLGIADGDAEREMAVGIDHQGESYALLVDAVGEVMKLSPASREANPVHMDGRWTKLSRGVHRLDDKLLIVLDIDSVLSFEIEACAA